MADTLPPERETVIRRGFLPENLPPVVSSYQLWDLYSQRDNSYLTTAKSIGSLCLFNASKRGGNRRIFSLPHPNFVFDQATYFNGHWSHLLEIFESSPGSLSKPISDNESRRAIRITPHSELPKLRLKALSRFKYCVFTDVARCFPSIYTHSIPWAINGKAKAKLDFSAQSTSIHGNRLDFLFRQAQQQQTVGIPVGPDTSRLTSEIILSAVDADFRRSSIGKKSAYLRHVDDYWIGANSLEDCEKLLGGLRKSLRNFELDTNEFKTKIASTNGIFGESWPTELERDLRRAFGAGPEKEDEVAALGRIINRATSENDDGMIRHAIRKLDEHHLWKKHWEVLEHFLAQCAVQFPHSFDYVARVVSWRSRIGEKLDASLWSEVIRNVCHQSAIFGRDGEALWALWLMKEIKLSVNKTLSDAVIANNSAIVCGFLAHLHANGLTSDKKIPAKLWDNVDGDIFCGPDWPLALELMHLDVVKPSGAVEKAHPSLRLLHQAKTSLINWNAAPPVFSTSMSEDEPDQAIEDFSSEYDGDKGGEDFDDDDFGIPL